MALSGGPIIGKNCILYYDADGAIATPTWVALTTVQNVSHDFSRDVAEIKERGEDDTTVMLGHINRSVTFDLTFRPDATNYDAIEQAAENGTKIGIAVYSGAIATQGHRGAAFEAYITEAPHPQGHTDSIRTFTARPAADYTTAPTYAETA